MPNEALRPQNPVLEVGCEPDKMGNVEGIDAIASSFLRAMQLQCIVENSATQSDLGSGLQRCEVVSFEKTDNLAAPCDAFRHEAVGFGGMNHGSDGEASERAEGFSETVCGNHPLMAAVGYLAKGSERWCMMGMMGHGERHQDGGIEV